MDRKIESLQREMQAMAARLREMDSATSQHEGHKTSNSHISGGYTPVAASASGTGTTASSSAGAALHRILNPPKSPSYVGPTSAEFGLTAHKKGDSDDEETGSSTSDTLPTTGDALGELGLDEGLRLLAVYEHSVGIMYPCVDLDSVRMYITDFYRADGHAAVTANVTNHDWFFARDVSVVKTILATALLAESHGRSERAAQLADSVEDDFAGRVKIAEVDMKELLILTLLVCCISKRDCQVQ